MPFKLDRPRRVHRSGEYSRIYKTGVKSVGRYLILFSVAPAPEAEEGAATQADTKAGGRLGPKVGLSVGPRVGWTVSGKVGNSCVRNKIKRRIREALRQELDDAMPPSNLVFVAKRQILKASLEDIKSDIRALLGGRR
jgi:ribonuclease P protein component